MPSTKGFSGPIIMKSISLPNIKSFSFSKFFRSIFIFVAIAFVPAFPGKQKIFLILSEFFNDKHIACSRPPLPITPTFI